MGGLAVAARNGWRPARQQLRLLSGLDADDGAEDWDNLRRNADVAAWLAPPTLNSLRTRPRIYTATELVAPKVCAWIIRQSEPRLQRAEVHDPETGLPVMGATRTNRVANFGLLETGVVNLLVQARIAAATGAPIAMMEAFAVLNYRVGEEASEHHDFLDPAVPAYAADIARLGQRVATCLLYLNGDYDGGETDFPLLGFSHKGTGGEALIFHSTDAAGVPDPSTLHAGRPPTAGEKWVLSQFIRNRTWLDQV
jgi:prolyl 4-hydroxylase